MKGIFPFFPFFFFGKHIKQSCIVDIISGYIIIVLQKLIWICFVNWQRRTSSGKN